MAAGRAGDGLGVGDQIIQFTCPERVEFSAQSRHPPWVQTVVLEPSVSSAGDQAGLGEHPQMLGYCRTADGKVAGQLGHRLFAMTQQLQQAPTVGLGHGSYQIRHLNTLAVTNALRKGGRGPRERRSSAGG